MDVSERISKKHICVGILAHVDAGKTTLSESILFLTGRVRKLGRVDHKDAFLDHNELERNRGITIFSKQAVFDLGDMRVTLLDTPGHVDFSAEMERTLQVLDYAILVINGADGVQGHTRTLWNLLKRYEIPVFLFVNKMDQAGTDREALLEEMKKSLDESVTAFDTADHAETRDVFLETLAMCDENILESYLQTGEINQEEIVRLIAERKVYPCYFGSALKVKGVQEFLDGIRQYARQGGKQDQNKKNKPFGAKVYKISRDAQGNRLTHMKITSGVLRVKDVLGDNLAADNHWEEKVNQIRIYSGEKYETVSEAEAGMICTVTGLNYTYPGEGLGMERESKSPMLEPVLNYQVQLPEGCNVHTVLHNLRLLEEEDPMLCIVWEEELGEIHVRLMGEVQIEILKSLIRDRFGMEVSFATGNIVYKETIKNVVEGVGHFEPLRHYAEVHLLLEPMEPGSGLEFDTICSEDMLDRNWQRLILTHLQEKVHRGVLTGAAITDMKIVLAAGRAHLKHTEGGDFRQSTYRAVRQGLMQAESVLLEPYYEFRLEIPSDCVGRALSDIQRMYGEFASPQMEGDMAVLTGKAPVSCMRDYQTEVAGYTKGQGRLSLVFGGYEPCHNTEEVIREIGYEPENDLGNPTGSVFCTHGAGFYVPWKEVPEYMHIESQLKRLKRERQDATKAARLTNTNIQNGSRSRNIQNSKGAYRTAGGFGEEDKELEEIFIRTYGKVERRNLPAAQTIAVGTQKKGKEKEKLPEYFLVDGYNVIFAWEELKELAKDNIEAARNKLMDILCNYQGYKKCTLILVFDAYRVEGPWLEIQKYHNIYVVYTKEKETADQYIEKVVHQIGRKYHVTVATSDGVEQVITVGQGASLISARELEEEVELMKQEIREEYLEKHARGKNYLFDHMDEELVERMERIRMGEEEPW